MSQDEGNAAEVERLRERIAELEARHAREKARLERGVEVITGELAKLQSERDALAAEHDRTLADFRERAAEALEQTHRAPGSWTDEQFTAERERLKGYNAHELALAMRGYFQILWGQRNRAICDRDDAMTALRDLAMTCARNYPRPDDDQAALTSTIAEAAEPIVLSTTVLRRITPHIEEMMQIVKMLREEQSQDRAAFEITLAYFVFYALEVIIQVRMLWGAKGAKNAAEMLAHLIEEVKRQLKSQTHFKEGMRRAQQAPVDCAPQMPPLTPHTHAALTPTNDASAPKAPDALAQAPGHTDA